MIYVRRCAWLTTLSLLACAHVERGTSPRLETQLVELEALTREARDRGAYRCAPEELARSEAHLEFAKRELEQGDRSRAREHLVLVSANAKAALRLSGNAGCTATSPSDVEARSFGRERNPVEARSAARAPNQKPRRTVGARSELTNNTAQLTKRRGSTKEHVAI